MGFLSNDLLTHIRERAGAHDLTNEFPMDDLKDLRETKYLSAFVPEEYGGAGLSLEEIAAEQTHLTKVAPGTALGINMHQIIVGLGRHLPRNRNPRGETILRSAVADELYSFGISEPGNNLVLFGSITGALPDSEGGYSFEGVKVFIPLVPMWTRLMTLSHDDSGEDGSRLVFAIFKREDGGFSIKDDWNTLDMHATQSSTTVLEDAYAPEGHILTRCEPGPSKDPVVFDIFSHFEILLAATRMGIGKRAVEVAAGYIKTRRSVENQSVYANDPDIRWRIAKVAITMNVVGPQIHELTRDIGGSVGRGPIQMPQLSTVRNAATEASLRVVEQLIRAYGGGAYYNGRELSHLYQDALTGLFQPSDQGSLHGAWARVVLGPVTEQSWIALIFGNPCLYSPSGHSLPCLPALGGPCLYSPSGHKSDNGCAKHRLAVSFPLARDSSVSSRMVRALQRGCHCPTCTQARSFIR